MPSKVYNDSAVLIPGTGAVYIGAVGAAAPTAAQLDTWLKAGRMDDIASFKPLGYTSLDDLPAIDSETEGGEVKGVWENPALRTTPITTSESITVTPVQFTEEVLKHRFGKDGKFDAANGVFELPTVYTSSEVSILVLFVDGSTVLGVQFDKAASAPEGGIEPDAENFLGLPTKYTILNHAGKKGRIISSVMKSTQ